MGAPVAAVLVPRLEAGPGDQAHPAAEAPAVRDRKTKRDGSSVCHPFLYAFRHFWLDPRESRFYNDREIIFHIKRWKT